jgi:DNA-binding NarL/FixJ family response regulator
VTIRVLIADDERLVRAGLRMLLSAEDDLEVVAEAADGREAVAAAGRSRPDVVLMDIRMPVMDGIEATRRILDHDRAKAAPDSTPRVIVLTTFELDEYVYAALRIGASGFLRKDAPEADLLDAIRVAADGGALFSPTVTRRLVELIAERREATPPPAGIGDLTDREGEVFSLIAMGLSNREIADRLGVTEHTAKTHVSHVLGKLDLRDRVQAVILAYETGLAGRAARPGAEPAAPRPRD